jgi:uncharacterized membrane protein YsdA (DUF1294 family)
MMIVQAASLDLREIALICIGIWSLAVSLYTFFAFARDKRAARRHRRRTSEHHLHVLELIGGFPGAWLAILLLRHKSSKPSFLVVSFLASVGNLIIAGLITFLVLLPSSS